MHARREPCDSESAYRGVSHVSGTANTAETAFEQHHAVPISAARACGSWSVASDPAKYQPCNSARAVI